MNARRFPPFFPQVLRESMAATVERLLAARPGLRKEAEEEAMNEAQLVSTSTNSTGRGRSEEKVPSLEELVAEKTEELRNMPHNPTEGGSSPSFAGQEEDNHKASRGTETLPIADAGWPWPMDWLSAPRAPPGTAEVQELPVGIIFGGLDGGDADVGSDDGVRAEAPPFSIVVAAVEVVDIEDAEAAHVEVRASACSLRAMIAPVLVPMKETWALSIPRCVEGEIRRLCASRARRVGIESAVFALWRAPL